MTKWAVVGSRNFADRVMLERVLAETVKPEDTIVSGGARGPDSWAELWAKHYGIASIVHKPDWSQGRGAGFARNSLIVRDADAVLAFWDGQSRGTMDTVRKAEAAGKPVSVFTFKRAALREGERG